MTRIHCSSLSYTSNEYILPPVICALPYIVVGAFARNPDHIVRRASWRSDHRGMYVRSECIPPYRDEMRWDVTFHAFIPPGVYGHMEKGHMQM